MMINTKNSRVIQLEFFVFQRLADCGGSSGTDGSAEETS